jgi:SAM-dependent methyltransferase
VDEYIEANREHWNEVAPLHAESDFYRVQSFRDGESKLKPVEVAELGDVRGKTLLHLQCHFGLDTLSWARDGGARVTGVDFAPDAVGTARALAEELGIPARFIESEIYSLPEKLDERFDVVFTSYGALCWLPDIRRWAEVAAHFVKPGGVLYVVEFHPIVDVFDDAPGADDLRFRYRYFQGEAPVKFQGTGTYAVGDAGIKHDTTYTWVHPIGDVVTAVIDAGLRLEFLHEFPFSTYQFLPFTEEVAPHTVRLTKHDGAIPLMHSLKARASS